MIDTEFELKTINAILDNLKTAENSVVLLLPQIFNIKVGDYLENINIDEIKNTKQDYNTFIFKVAEMPNLLPVIFLYTEKNENSPIDLSSYSYFKDIKDKFNLKKFNYIRVKSKKLWYSVNDLAFYEEYEKYPFEVPLLFDYKNKILINAALEAVRRYYKFPRSYIKYENNNLNVGSIINIPCSKNGGLIIKKYNNYSKIYSAKEILNLDKEKLNDKIIIIKSSNNTVQTMISMATLIESIMSKNFIKYNKKIDYFLALIIALILFFIFKEIKILKGLILTLFLIGIEFFIAANLIKKNIYFDYTLFMHMIFFVFFSVYIIEILRNRQIFKTRKNFLVGYVPENRIKTYIDQNIDIKIKNAWLKTSGIYIVFDSFTLSEPEKLKITFEKIKLLIYNITDKYLVKINNFNEIFIVFLEEMDLKKLIDLLFKIRESIDKINYNIFINNTEINFLEYNGDIIFIDKKYEYKLQADNIEKKGYILISGDDIQQYIDLIKFQKITSAGKHVFFNAISKR